MCSPVTGYLRPVSWSDFGPHLAFGLLSAAVGIPALGRRKEAFFFWWQKLLDYIKLWWETEAVFHQSAFHFGVGSS